MAIATDDILLREVLQNQERMPFQVIPNYAFGWDGMHPKHEVDLRCYYKCDQDGHPRIARIECDNGRSKPCWEKIWLPEKAVDELEREIAADLRDEIARDEE